MSVIKEELVRGDLKIVMDSDEYFPDDPGQGTPVLIIKGDWKHTGTFNCALDTGYLDMYQLTNAEYNWIDKQGRKIEDFYKRCSQLNK